MKKWILVAAVLFLLCSATAVQAQDWVTQDKFQLEFGGWLVNFNTGATLDSVKYQRGTNVDFEKDLRLDDDKTVFQLGGYWRFLPKHRLEFSYVQVSRDSSADLLQPVKWGEYTFDVGVHAKLSAKSRRYQLNYLWSFYQTGQSEAGLQLGLTWLNISASLRGSGNVYLSDEYGQNRQWVGSAEEDASLDAPVPTLGLFWDYYFNEHWMFRSRISYFSAKIGDIDGDVFEGKISVDWLFSDHVGFGLGYDYVDYSVKDEGGDIHYKADWETDGIMAYFSFRF